MEKYVIAVLAVALIAILCIKYPGERLTAEEISKREIAYCKNALQDFGVDQTACLHRVRKGY